MALGVWTEEVDDVVLGKLDDDDEELELVDVDDEDEVEDDDEELELDEVTAFVIRPETWVMDTVVLNPEAVAATLVPTVVVPHPYW